MTAVHRLCAAVLLMLPGGMLAATPVPQEPVAQAAAERGLRAFEAGDWSASAAHLAAAREAGHPAQAALWFALGHCAYRDGDVPLALSAWQRARAAGAPGDAVAEALAIGEARAGLEPGGSAPPPDTRAPSRGLLLGVAVLLECLGVLMMLSLRPPKRFVGLLLAAVGLAASVPAAAQLSRPVEAAVVVAPGQVLRVAPHPASTAGTTLAAGEGVAVLRASGRWAEVRARGGTGWLPAGAVVHTRPFADG